MTGRPQSYLAANRAAQRIREYRRARGLTQQALADAVGRSRKQISDWENGRAIAAPEAIKQLQRAGVCDPGDWYASAEPAAA